MTHRLFPTLFAGLALAAAFVSAANCGSSGNQPFQPATTTGGGSSTGGGGAAAGGMGGMGGQTCKVELCPGKDTACLKRGCEGVNCTKIKSPQETKCSEDGGKLCDDTGACVKCLKMEDCAGSDICQDKNCIPAACVNMKKDNAETDVDCGGKECNPCDKGKGCLKGVDCKTGFCQKPDVNSPGSCASCGKDEDCGESPGTYCKAGLCVKKKDNGDVCTGANECGSGQCPKQDGVCCDSACSGSCLACLSEKTGAATGSCAPVTKNADPDKECGDQGAKTCGSNATGCNGVLNGTGCNLYPDKTPCAPAQCKDGKETVALQCDGKGTCVMQTATACAPYTCDAAGSVCLKTCSKDAECVATSYCDGATKKCLPKKDDGNTCDSGAHECKSGNCPAMDGVCCDKPCNGECVACTKTKTGLANSGTCGPIPNKADPDGECAPGTAACCNGAGACLTQLGCLN